MRKKVSRVAISMCAAASMVLSVVAPAMTVAAETTDEPVELTVWSWDKTMNGTTFEVADSLDDDVTVNFVEMSKADCLQKIHTVLASGVTDDLPDIVSISDLNAQGYLMSYPDAFLPMDDYINYDDFASYKKDMVSYDGVGYGVPYDTGVAALFYRTDYMEEIGVTDEDMQDQLRNMLKPFYGVLKTMDGAIRFALLTGVTKFGKVSVFSDLNNLMDISMDDRYVEICGITEKEIHTCLEDEVRELAGAQDMTYEETCLRLKECYDGYHFVENSIGMYNPFSLLNTFARRKFGDYWFETGRPSYLVELLKHTHYDLYEMANTETDVDVLNSIDSASINPVPVIYQSGYLTIKDYDPEFGIYRLGFPNREVEEGFVKYLLPFYTSVSAPKTPFEIGQLVREIRSGDYDAFFRRLQSFFADTPYEVIAGQKPERDTELHYRNVLFIVFKLVGLYTQVEYHTSQGRIDLVLKTDRYIYVMEFKLNGTAEEALRQIEERQYALPFASDPRQVFKIGVNFSSVTRNIERWLVE